MKNLIRVGVFLNLLMGLVAIPVEAQEAATTGGGSTLETIVVTAEKRQEDAQKVPIAITALGSNDLAAQRIITTQDLQFAVPGLVYNNLAEFAEPFLRGIGTDITGPNADPSVATYVDGVFSASSSGTIFNLLGIERVEVLEGPQGTLYGRNAVGGAINIYTLTPTQKTDAAASATFGDYADKEFSAHLSGGVTDNLAIGVYVAGTERNSYLHNFDATLPPGEPNYDSSWGVRLKAVYTPNTWLTLTGSAEHLQTRDFDDVGEGQLQTNAVGYAYGAPAHIGNYFISEDYGDYLKTLQSNAALREEVDLDALRIVGISGYRNLRETAPVDIDATAAAVIGATGQPLVSREWSQELQVLSADKSLIQWIAGAYIFSEHGGYDPEVENSAFLFPGFQNINLTSNVTTDSYALFGQTSFPLAFIVHGLRLTLGGRYTIDHKRLLASEFFANAANIPVAPSVVFPASSKTWDKFTPKVTVDYSFDRTLLYGTYSKGFKSGVYNIAAPGTPGPVNPETLTDYEIGSKSDLLNSRLRVNTSAYYYDFKDIQVEIVNPTAAGTTILQNAASATAYGGELGIDAVVTDNLVLGSGVAYEHSRYDRYDNFAGFEPAAVGNTQVAVDASGNEMQRAPNWVISTKGDYTQPLSSGDSLKVHVGWYYNGGYFWDAGNQLKQRPYNLVDASLSYVVQSQGFSVKLWGKNLTNQFYYTSELMTAFGTGAQYAAPRMVGVTFDWHLR
jgi:iron complex outermembrane receptor protein